MLMKRTYTSSPRTHGFSLIEVMVAVVVICIGLLGIAKMQAMAVSNTNMSRQRSLAAIAAASFASSMHSNRQYWGSLVTAVTVTITGKPAVVTVPTDAALQAQTAADLAGPSPTVVCIGNSGGLPTCNNATNLAAFDLARWWATSVSVQLPNPTAIVTCPQTPVGNPAPISCTVQISWLEKAVAMNSTEAAKEAAAPSASASEQPIFTLYVEP